MLLVTRFLVRGWGSPRRTDSRAQGGWLLAALGIVACHNTQGASDSGAAPPLGRCEQPFKQPQQEEKSDLRINEVLTSNDGAAIDEQGETNDFVELINTGSGPVSLLGLYLADSNNAAPLPDMQLAPGARLVLWADDQLQQGETHLPFKLDQDGEHVSLWRGACVRLDQLEVPSLAVNQTFARFPDGTGEATRCRYASAGRDNGASCDPPAPPELSDDVSYQAYTIPADWPSSESPLLIRALALAPSGQVELANRGTSAVSLQGMSLRLAAHAAGASWPGATEGAEITLPPNLAPGAKATLALDAAALAVLQGPTREGVLTWFADAGQRVVDRVDFMSLPDGSALTRELADPRHYRLCTHPAPSATCQPVAERTLGDRARALSTPGDFSALARGGTEVGNSAVKFVVDMTAGDVVHLLSNARWALHYTFIREQIYNQPALDRCDAAQAAAFQQGWWDFSVSEYFRVEGRRFLLGTLVHNANGLNTVEFAVGDAISPEQMKRAFYAVVPHTEQPSQWALRPQDGVQRARMKELEGQLPIVGTNAPFRDAVYQPLTPAVGYGRLRFIPAAELEGAALGPQVIVITDDVPNDIAFVGGLITEAFQAPLAHVNVLSEARGTPNMALRHAHSDTRVAPLLDKLVRLEVGTGEFLLREASAEEAAAFYASRMPQGPRLSPAHDDSLRGVQPLARHGIASALTIGSKAAQLAELARVDMASPACSEGGVPLHTPANAFAVPFAHYTEHFNASGAARKLTELLADASFHADASQRALGLGAVRRLILEYPVDEKLRYELALAVRQRFGEGVVRFRSSSNMEDLDTFNGAGLHTSSGASLASDAEVTLDDALRIVWSSLWNDRAYDEREAGHLEQTAARMGVLVHDRFDGEAAQGVAISRNLLDVTRSDIYYINAQHGEASVTNPAPGVTTEQLLYIWPPRSPEIAYQSHSSLRDEAVLSLEETRALACSLAAIHQHFRALIDPLGKDRTFAMQIEWKLEHGTRALAIKQARPQPFGNVEIPSDCREL
jgi:hypothetical protein